MAEKFYSGFAQYYKDMNAMPNFSFKKYGNFYNWRRGLTQGQAEYDRQMASQKTELETLRSGGPKTVNYSTAMTKNEQATAGVQGDDDRARAAALEELERERLGAKVKGMGSTSLLGVLK